MEKSEYEHGMHKLLHWRLCIEFTKNAHYKPWKQCIRTLHFFWGGGVIKQENMPVSSKCTLVVDPDAPVRGKKALRLWSVSFTVFGMTQVEVTETASNSDRLWPCTCARRGIWALWWIKYVTCLILSNLLITLPGRGYLPTLQEVVSWGAQFDFL